MRLGVDARPLNHPHTGVGRYAYEILLQIGKKTDWQIFLYGVTKENARHLLDQSERSCFNIRPAPLQLKMTSTVFMQYVTPFYLERDKVSLFFSPRHHLPKTTIPSVVTVHDLTWVHQPQSMKRFGRLVETLLMPDSLRRASAVICVSNATHEDVISFDRSIAGKSHVVYEGISQSLVTHISVSSTPEPGVITALFVGTFEPRKNLIRVLEALALLRSKDIPIKLTLFGSKGWNTDITKAVHSLDLQKSVEIRSGNDNVLASVYQTADFLIMPSLYEGFGLPIVEAMSFGLPVVTSRGGAPEEIADGGGHFVNPYSTEDIAEGMKLISNDIDLRNRLREAAIQRSKDFSWERAGDQTIEILRKALD